MHAFEQHGAAALLQKRTDIIRWQDNICKIIRYLATRNAALDGHYKNSCSTQLFMNITTYQFL